MGSEFKERITDLIFWTVIFVIMYLIIAFLLESSWLTVTVTLPDCYQLFKDCLFLTAAFLAPASAFLLFSDWRKQYVEKKTDDTARKLRSYLNDIYIIMWQAHYFEPKSIDGYNIHLYEDVKKGSFFDIRKQIDEEKLNLKNRISDNSGIIKKLEEAMEFSLEIYNIVINVKYCESRLKELCENKEINLEEINQIRQLKSKNDIDFTNKIEQLKQKKDTLDDDLLEIQI